MEYDLLTQDEMDEMVVSFHRAQQRDHFLHTLNLARYDDMLETMPAGKLAPEVAAWKTRVQQLRDETASRLVEVEHIINATEKQMPTGMRRAEVLGNLIAKEEAQRLAQSARA